MWLQRICVDLKYGREKLVIAGMRVGADKKSEKLSPEYGPPPHIRGQFVCPPPHPHPPIYAFWDLNGFASISKMMVLVQKRQKSADRQNNLIPVIVMGKYVPGLGSGAVPSNLPADLASTKTNFFSTRFLSTSSKVLTISGLNWAWNVSNETFWTSSVNGRFSWIHSGNPPSRTETSLWPKTLKVHHTRCAENIPKVALLS